MFFLKQTTFVFVRITWKNAREKIGKALIKNTVSTVFGDEMNKIGSLIGMTYLHVWIEALNGISYNFPKRIWLENCETDHPLQKTNIWRAG